MKNAVLINTYGPRLADLTDDAVYIAMNIVRKIEAFLHNFPFIESAIFITICSAIFLFYFKYFRRLIILP